MAHIINTLAEVSDAYDTLFCDLWRCVHDGVHAFPDAVAALQQFKAKGGTVLLLTNAPRPWAEVAQQLDRLNVPRMCWDVIATSGDSARAAMFRGAVGRRVWHVGEPRDTPFFDPMALVYDDAVQIRRVDLDQADGIVCTGPFDPYADPSQMRPQFMLAKARGLKLLCANPDIVVDRGDRREWCAGALAALYTDIGGESLYFGKPHPPIYDLARGRLRQINKPTENDRILVVGDGMRTDVLGGLGEGFDTLFVTGGLARAETHTQQQPDADRLARLFTQEELDPTYAIGMLR